jgi:hypothetical protein
LGIIKVYQNKPKYDMKINKKTFDFTFVITTAVTLIIFSEFNLLENISYSIIPILIAYYLGQYSMKLPK